MTKEQRDKLYEYLMGINFPQEETPETGVLKISGFGCYQAQVVALVQRILEACGSDVRAVSEAHLGIFSFGRVLVPESCINSHNYPVGEPLVVLQDGRSACLKIDGETGNQLPDFGSGHGPRQATPEEIRKFCDTVPHSGLFVIV